MYMCMWATSTREKMDGVEENNRCIKPMINQMYDKHILFIQN